MRIVYKCVDHFQIHCAIVFTEGVFEGETQVVHPSRPRGELEIELRPPKNAPVDIHVKVCVGPPGADLLQVAWKDDKKKFVPCILV